MSTIDLPPLQRAARGHPAALRAFPDQAAERYQRPVPVDGRAGGRCIG